MVTLAKVGHFLITNMALRLGFGKNFNLISNSERNGLMPTKTWIKDNLGNDWKLGDTLVAGIGHLYFSNSYSIKCDDINDCK